VSHPAGELELLEQRAAELGVAGGRAQDVRRVHAEVPGGTVSALRWAGAPVDGVFLHGGGQNAHTWDTLLLRSGTGALAVDFPGHGRSSWIDDSAYRARDLAPLVAGAIEVLAPSAQVVVGVSLGGLTALRLATIRPDLVRRLVLVDVSPASTPDRVEDVDDFLARDDFASLDEMVDHTLRFRPGASRRSIRRSVLYNAVQADDGSWSWRHDRRDTPLGDRKEQVYADLPSYWDDVSGLRCPTLLVRGEQSAILTPDDVDTYRRLLPSIEVVEVPGSGHMVQSDAPEQLGALIEAFVRSP
jgi:esterase